MLKVLFCGLKNEYGKPERGVSFEYKHFFGALQRMPGVEAEMFAMDEVAREVGRDEMNRRLIYRVEDSRPDLLFCFLFTDELKPETIGYITRKTSTKTFNWFGDDHWRFYAYSRRWAPLFTLVSTTDGLAYKNYQAAGISNVIKTQWGVNQHLYKPQDKSRDQGQYNITFYGQKYGNRGSYINSLKKNDLPARGIGRGWGGSGADVQEMLDIYSFSKINLNFTETYYYGLKKKINLIARLFIKKELGRYRLNLSQFADNWRAMVGTQRRTIKARTFEVPACGGFLLTGPSDDPIDEYFVPGKEIAVFNTASDLIAQCRYFLECADERQAMAKAGFERALREHTYEQRFRKIFEKLL